MKLTFKTMHRLELPENCEALVDWWERTNQQERETTTAFANTVARHLALCNCPPFVIDFRELAQAKDVTPMHIRISKLNDDGKCILGLPQHKQLFQISFEQFFQAEAKKIYEKPGYAKFRRDFDWLYCKECEEYDECEGYERCEEYEEYERNEGYSCPTNYFGTARAVIMMEGDCNKIPERIVPPEFAGVVRDIVYGAYYEATFKHRRDWHMKYHGAARPSLKKPKAINNIPPYIEKPKADNV